MYHRFNSLLAKCALMIPILAIAFVVIPQHPASASSTGGGGGCPPKFNLTTTQSNTSGYITTIDNACTNGYPIENLQVVQVWPNNYDPHPLGVWYNSFAGKWTVFNEDIQPIPLGTTFTIRVYGGVGTGTGGSPPIPWELARVTATSSNTVGDYVLINSSITNNNPQALVQATQFYTGTYDPHEIGVWYTGSNWAVFNKDQSAIPLGATFTLFLTYPADPLIPTIVQQATTANTSSYVTYIDNPQMNGNPNLFLYAVSLYNANGQCGCVLNNHQIGVWYNTQNGRWSVYNVDLAPMPVGAEFYVSIV